MRPVDGYHKGSTSVYSIPSVSFWMQPFGRRYVVADQGVVDVFSWLGGWFHGLLNADGCCNGTWNAANTKHACMSGWIVLTSLYTSMSLTVSLSSSTPRWGDLQPWLQLSDHSTTLERCFSVFSLASWEQSHPNKAAWIWTAWCSHRQTQVLTTKHHLDLYLSSIGRNPPWKAHLSTLEFLSLAQAQTHGCALSELKLTNWMSDMRGWRSQAQLIAKEIASLLLVASDALCY